MFVFHACYRHAHGDDAHTSVGFPQDDGVVVVNRVVVFQDCRGVARYLSVKFFVDWGVEEWDNVVTFSWVVPYEHIGNGSRAREEAFCEACGGPRLRVRADSFRSVVVVRYVPPVVHALVVVRVFHVEDVAIVVRVVSPRNDSWVSPIFGVR